jgi:ubiquinone/menaquinone biosynthesis C-methylase UbiE
MIHNITLIKWFHLHLILTSLKEINVKAGIMLLKDGKCGGNLLRGAQKLSSRLVEPAEIKQGQRVLDIASGIGEPAMTAAKVVGSSGQVLATDISVQMLTIAKERAASSGLQEIIRFRESDAENLDLPNSSFDAVLCRWGLMLKNIPTITAYQKVL